MPIRIIIQDDRGSQVSLDFDEILTQPEKTGRSHTTLMEWLRDVPVSQERSDLLSDLENEMVRQFVLGYLALCEGCEEFVLSDLAHHIESEDKTVCGRCL